jgi:hypothetical protein
MIHPRVSLEDNGRQERLMTTNPVFVVGAQRSGTTALGLILSKHDKILMTVHGKLLYYLILWIYYDFSPASQFHVRIDEIVHSLKRRPILGIDPLETEKIMNLLVNQFYFRDFEHMTKEEIIAYIWTNTYHEIGKDKEIVGDKYNEYLLQLNQIIAIFPKARFVFLHRHYQDVAESMVRHFAGRPMSPKTYEDAAIKWAQWNDNWLNFREGLQPDQRCEISYLDMVTQPRRVFSEIGSFLGIPVDELYLSLACDSLRQDRLDAGKNIQLDFGEIEKVFPRFGDVAKALGY